MRSPSVSGSAQIRGTRERCLIDHGVAGYLFRYQPVDRYWSIQAVESVLAVLAGAAILAVGALRLRRRVT